jgi:hypothetical protein
MQLASGLNATEDSCHSLKLAGPPDGSKMNSPLNLPAIAEAAASTAATWLRQTVAPRKPDDWQVKGHHDFVTEVDRTAEAMITEALLTAVPDSRGSSRSPVPDRGRPG